MIDVKSTGAVGNGTADDTAAIQNALNSEEREICIPDGEYRITDTLKIPSHKYVRAGNRAHLIFRPERPLNKDDFLMSNADTENGNEDITVEGGIWDGGYGGKYNVKAPDLFDENACSGACLNFAGVKHLKLLNFIVANTVIYHIRMCRLRDFEIRNIGFSSEKLAYNQDGLHFNGEVYDGVVENIRALTDGQTNDDLIALNADDSMVRLENRGMVRGPIENVVFRNIYADNCHTAVRLASVTSPIRNIVFENVYAGCRCYAINMDALRYCRTPLIDKNSDLTGVGCIENVTFRDLRVFFTGEAHHTASLICAETNADRFRITGFERIMEKDARPDIPTLRARNLTREIISTDGSEPVKLSEMNQEYTISGSFSELSMDCSD